MFDLLKEELTDFKLSDLQLTKLISTFKASETLSHSKESSENYFDVYRLANLYKKYHQYLEKEGYTDNELKQLAISGFFSFTKPDFDDKKRIMERFGLKEEALLGDVSNIKTEELYARLRFLISLKLNKSMVKDIYLLEESNFIDIFGRTTSSLEIEYPFTKEVQQRLMVTSKIYHCFLTLKQSIKEGSFSSLTVDQTKSSKIMIK